VPPLAQDLRRQLGVLAKQIAKGIWEKLNATRKLAKSDATNILSAFQEEYHIAIEDKGADQLGTVLTAIYRILGDLSSSGMLVSTALHDYTLNTIVLYPGDEIKQGCYAGAMADYEQDECRMYIAAGRILDDLNGPLTLGEHNVGKDFRTVFSHEIGHLVMGPFEMAIGEKFRITFDAYPDKFWQSRVSEYAGTDDHELFGEAFAAWTHPDYGKDGQVLPAVLEALFTKAGITSGAIKKLAKAKKKSVDVLTPDGVLVSASTIDGLLNAVDDSDWFIIEGTLSPAMLSAFEDAGYSELTTAGVGADAKMVENVSRAAKEYSESHSADLVSGLSDTTRDQLRGTVEDAIEEGWSQKELTTEIMNNFSFGDVRANLIARNELGLAYSKGRQGAAEDAGATGKRSLLSADHDDGLNCDCTEAAEAGVVDFDESFTDDPDYDFAPYHVNCECDWVGVYGESEDDGGEDQDDGGEDQEDESDTEKFVKDARHDSVQTIDNIDTEYVNTPLSDEDQKANDDVQNLSAAALLLGNDDDIHGQRITGRANKFTLEAVNNFESAQSRAVDHRQAYEMHMEAAKHYQDDDDHKDPKAVIAHEKTAAAHKEIYDRLVAQKLAKEYNPDQPRDDHGRWGDGPGYSKDGKVWKDADGKKVDKATQQRLEELKVPPAWTNVRLNPDKNGARQVMGKDAKGRTQSIYSAKHSEQAAAEKFARLRDFNKAAPAVRAQAYKDMANSKLSQGERDTAAATVLIAETGMRVGSNQDTGAEKKAYGASNMKASQVKINGDTATFRFTGKKGVTQNIKVTSPKLAAYLSDRKDAASGGRGAQLFQTDSGQVRSYVRGLAGDNFSTKDFRTWVGTATALNAIKGMKIPTSEASYNKSMKAVGKVVGARLGNTASVALNSYIDPTVFSVWGFKNGK
jgi:DNA topoisomerase I